MKRQMERGESCGSHSSGDDVTWATLVPLDSNYSDIQLRSNEVTICSEIKSSSSEKQEWCKIIKEKDQISALMHNKSFNPILVDGTVVHKDDMTIIRCGSEIILGPEADGFIRYLFKVIPAKNICKQLKIILDPEHAKCSICLNVWHNVVTVAPCFHNFCNACFSVWLKRCEAKHSNVLCPLCRAVVKFVGRNHFLHSIEEDIMQSDSSLRRSNEEIALLDAGSSIKSPLVVRRGRQRARSTSSDDASDSRTANAGLIDEFQSMESEIRRRYDGLESRMQILEEKMQRMEATQRLVVQALERLTPGMMQSLTQQLASSSVRPPPPL